MKMGLYGGTFDPIHNGHLLLAEWIREKLELDKIAFIPAFIPPHKMTQKITAAELRFQMIQLAIRSNPHFEVSDYEVNKQGVSFSIDSILHFRSLYGMRPEQLFFLIGSDSLIDFDGWYKPDEILKNCRIIVYRRSHFNPAMVKHAYVQRVTFVENPYIDISSSDIRSRVFQGRSIKYMVSPEVEAFILGNSLYVNKS